MQLGLVNAEEKLLHSQCFSVFTEVFLFFVTYGTPTFASDIHFCKYGLLWVFT